MLNVKNILKNCKKFR